MLPVRVRGMPACIRDIPPVRVRGIPPVSGIYLFCFAGFGALFTFFVRGSRLGPPTVDDLLDGLLAHIDVVAEPVDKDEIVQILGVFRGERRRSKGIP